LWKSPREKGGEVGKSNEYVLKSELVEMSRRCSAHGWCPGSLGNISTVNSNLDRVYIKPTGADLSRLKLEDILTLDLNGKVLEGRGKPSTEKNFHLAMYRLRKDVRSVYHVHPPFATAYAVAGKEIPMSTEAARISLVAVPLLPHAPPGSIELAQKVTDGFKDPRVKAVLLRDHGVVSIGETLEKAYRVTALVEDAAKVGLLSSLIKGQIRLNPVDSKNRARV
jgi:ribulose-5-phosphate 4-epimerase/fuculose-1-phosphate aldolase